MYITIRETDIIFPNLEITFDELFAEVDMG